MSTTLTWQSSGNGAKTGTGVVDFINDLETLMNTHSSDPDFLWEVAGKDVAGSDYYLLLRRKDGSAGRIAWVFSGNNPHIFDGSASSFAGVAWFPAGTGTTLSNITGTGTMCGDDTGACKASGMYYDFAFYGANYLPFYFECEDGIIFMNGPVNAAGYICGAGKLLVDQSDVAYDCTFGTWGNTTTSWGTSSAIQWVTPAPAAGSAAPCIKTNYGSANRTYFQGYAVSGVWASLAIGATEFLGNSATQEAWFAKFPLLGNIRGEGMVLSFRQFGMGPATNGPFQSYATVAGVQAIQMCNQTAGVAGAAWCTNFKLP